MNWTEITAIATIFSMVAFITTAIVAFVEFRTLGKSRYLQVSSELFAAWQSQEFMEAQLWVIHRLQEATWEDFVKAHRADYGEAVFHRVGSFYDRVGALVRLRLIDESEIVTTIGPYAIAVWAKIEPLVKGARQAENSTLFNDFERLVPACYECYVPSLQIGQSVMPFTSQTEVPKITADGLRHRIEKNEPVAILDARQKGDYDPSAALPGAIRIPPDEVPQRLREIPPDRDLIVYCT